MALLTAKLLERFERDSAPEDLDEALVAARASLALTSTDDPTYLACFRVLPYLLREQYRLTGARRLMNN